MGYHGAVSFRELRPFRFSQPTGRWIEEPLAERPTTETRLTVVTFNVWFSDRDFEERCDAMMRLLHEADADIIALQEVTPDFLTRARRGSWLKERYCISDATGETVRGYGVALFSRLPIESLALMDLPSSMDRHLLLATCRVNGRKMAIATVHLESLREFGYVRKHQLGSIFAVLDEYETAILLGDLNFCSTWDENQAIRDNYVDLWPLLHVDDPGFTLVPREPSTTWPAVRFDRILVKSPPGTAKAKEIRMIGTSPVDPARPTLYPSDHFGLMADLRLT